ncbi:MAG: flagellar filament capping protein FliD [Bacillaceae bacterium]|nr:flagellar filament capping protein FliD [Bacillaceae bacterium]
MAGEIGFSGLASGIDTQALIDQLMAIERRPLVRMNGQLSDLESTKKIWQQINTKLKNLEQSLADLKSASTYTSKAVTSTSDNVATATAESTAADTTYNLEVIALAEAHSIASASDQVDPNNYFATNATANLSLTVGSQAQSIDITINDTDTMEDILDKINNQVATLQEADSSFIGVEASIINGQLVLVSEETGLSNAITVNTDDLGLLYDSGAAAFVNELQAAKDASFEINNLQMTRSTNTVDDAVSGVTFTLKETGTTSITVDKDADKTVDAVKKFVKAYNDAYEFIYDQYDISGDDNAAGNLKGDYSVSLILDNLWRKVTQEVNNSGALTHLSQIGIQTEGLTGDSVSGKLKVDETKLKEALQEDPSSVQQLFSNSNETGIADSLEEYLNSYIEYGTGIISERQKSIERQIEAMKDQIERFSDRMDIREQNLIRQFTEMEKALSAMSAQSNWFASQMASLPSYSQQK